MPRNAAPRNRPPTAAPCPCGRWIWFELVLAPGLALHERACPRCRKRALLLFRAGRFEGAVKLTGRDLRSLREALGELERLSESEVGDVLRIAAVLIEF